MLSSQPGTEDIRRRDQRAMLNLNQGRDVEQMQLRDYLATLLAQFDNHDIALELQHLHNSLPEEQRGGYRMEIAMMSKDYQSGAYDSSL